MIENIKYTSRDFYLSAFLVATGNELQRHTKDAMGLTTFVFNNSPELLEQVRKYYALEALVNPVMYGDAQRQLKSIIHEKQITNTHTYVSQFDRAK